jgi:glycosyltransferase involved in cell wall biosynthesis
LDSIAQQQFRDFEVVVSDDSPDDSVERLLAHYNTKFPILYFHNKLAKGTPANWNFGISKATGEWIKLIHDDDWFASPDSLGIFAQHIEQGRKFIFSAYANKENEQAPGQVMRMSASWEQRIIREPMTLLAYNKVGPPSVTMIHRSITETYDERMKWRVDMDFYVRLLLQEMEYTYINEVLINVGINELQVTNYCFQNPSVELPEGFLLLEKYGYRRLKNIWVYDAWWRLLRNMDILTPAQLSASEPGPWPPGIIQMVAHLRIVPKSMLKKGIFSKMAMMLSYLFNYSTTTK